MKNIKIILIVYSVEAFCSAADFERQNKEEATIPVFA